MKFIKLGATYVNLAHIVYADVFTSGGVPWVKVTFAATSSTGITETISVPSLEVLSWAGDDAQKLIAVLEEVQA